MLEVRALKKAYGKIVAVDGVSLRADSADQSFLRKLTSKETVDPAFLAASTANVTASAQFGLSAAVIPVTCR